MSALSDWLSDIASDARITAVETSEKDTFTVAPRCEICGGYAELTAWSQAAGYGCVLTVDATVETEDEGYESPMLLGEGNLACCLDCRDECLSRVNSARLAKTRPSEFPALREVSNG